MADQQLLVRIVGDEKDLLRAFKSSSQATQRFSASFGTFLKGAVIFEGVRAGIDAIGSAVRAGIDEFSEAQKVTAQTSAIIKATGGVANVTAKEVDALATQIQRLTGIDDEAIKSGEALLLTFRNVRNEVGKGNAIFDRATEAIVDLSAAGFGPINTLAKQVGKALQDPIKGLTSLTRAGVQFTKQQRDQVKAFVDSGRFLGAQKVILKEIETQVGGTAKAIGDTLPGQLAKLREAFRNAFGNLVGAVAQPLGRALGAFASVIPQIESSVERISATVGPALTRLVDEFTSKLPQLQRIAGAVLEPLRENVVPILREVGEVISSFWARVVAVFDARSGQIRQILQNLGAILVNVWTLARPTIVFLFEKAIPAALNIAIPVIEKLTGVTKALSDVYVRVVSTIVRVLDVFLGALARVADAASRLPFIGDSFKGVAERVNAGRESLRAFADQLDAIDGREVVVKLTVDTSTGRREEGALGRQAEPKDAKEAAEKAAKDAVASLEAQKRGATDIATAASAATGATEKALTATEKQRATFDALMASLGLRRDRAAATAGLKDDIAAATATKNALEEQLKVQKGNVELQKQLLQVNQEIASLRSEQRQGRQFQALGLTAEGQQRVASIGAIRARARNLIDQLKSSGLDPSKIRDAVRRISVVFTQQFDGASKDVRQAILGMFNEIAGALKEGTNSLKGPLTQTSGLNTKKLVDGLGLTPDQIRALRSRTSGFNTGGLALAGVGGQVAAGGFGGAQGAIVVESHTTIILDGQKVASVVTRNQQKARKRNPRQKRGPNRGSGI